MTSLFIDESKEDNYIIVVVAVADGDVARLRSATASLRLPRQQRVHFVKESVPRRRMILQKFETLGVRTHLFTAHGLSDLDAREWCLESVVDLAAQVRARRIILEMDDSIVATDKRTLYRTLDARDMRETVSYGHERAAAEPLLWIPDAVAWSYAKGGEWKTRAAPLIERIVDYPG
ncbi:hypothetical protein [Microbacterium sp.]|uniref:hypothetical protein n=1 Tax=Microbacterium sp. TaxID=51671 RepID=UPI003C133CE5